MLILLFLVGGFVAYITWALVGIATFDLELTTTAAVVAFVAVFFGGAWFFGIPIFTFSF